MNVKFRVCCAGLCAIAMAHSFAGDAAPFGIARRIPWNASRVIGSPDAPPPFRSVRIFPELKFNKPIYANLEAGTKNLWVIEHHSGYGGPGLIFRLKDEPDAKPEKLLTMDRIIYGVAFDPNYRKNGHVFIGSNGPDKEPTDKYDRVSRFTVSREAPHLIDPKSEVIILEWPSNGHNGADLCFDGSGLLCVTSGDGTSDSDKGNNGQRMNSLYSKLIRIDVHHKEKGLQYAIPEDNPFVGRAGTRPETWAYGFRNPWRVTYDKKTNQLWVGNNGQDLWEQVYLVQRGANYGWPHYEGGHEFHPNRELGPDPFVPPTVDHNHSEARSLTGGVVYHGAKFPELEGAYIYGDYSTGKIWFVRAVDGKIESKGEVANTRIQIVSFGLDSRGELVIVDHAGGLYSLERQPDSRKAAREAAEFPRKLSETGLFESVKGHKTDAGLIPYSVNSPLWSDGTYKERYIALPGDSQMEFESRGWKFEDGAVLVKSFAINAVRGKPATRKFIETRLMTRQNGEWAGYSYLWNEDQTDAVLVSSKGADRLFQIRSEDGTVDNFEWHYPSRTECMVCHTRASKWVLGLSEVQMNKVHDYGGVKDNQLRTLAHIGALTFKGAKTENALPKPLDSYKKLVDPRDPNEPLELRARSYLHANCAHCHVEAGGGNALMDLEFTTEPSSEKAHLINARPQHSTFNLKNAKLIAPGKPESSVLLHRISMREPGQMPQLATKVVDANAVKLITEWIKAMAANGQ